MGLRERTFSSVQVTKASFDGKSSSFDSLFINWRIPIFLVMGCPESITDLVGKRQHSKTFLAISGVLYTDHRNDSAIVECQVRNPVDFLWHLSHRRLVG